MKTAHVNAITGQITETDWTADEINSFDAAQLAQAWLDLRYTRNQLLTESDWTQANDSPVDKYAWAEYRQQLRDLPANTTDPFEPVWPTPPA